MPYAQARPNPMMAGMPVRLSAAKPSVATPPAAIITGPIATIELITAA
jgi:hypothetical protein